MKDKTLKTLIKQQMRQDTGNPYFTRKVMNSLPEKPRREPCLWVIRATYLVAALLLVLFWLRLALHGDMFGNGLTTTIVLWSLTLLLCFAGLQNIARKLAS